MMGWRDHLQKADDRIVVPWVGGRAIVVGARRWHIEGQLPPVHGWYEFDVKARKATVHGPAERGGLTKLRMGYLAGDRFVPDDIEFPAFGMGRDERYLARELQRVHLVDPTLERFERIVVGQTWAEGPLIYYEAAWPVGPEDEVRQAYEDEELNLLGIAGVSPALQTAFYFEDWVREQATRRRAEAAARRAEAEARRALEERRAELVNQLGNAETRRELAKIDFPEAARQALAVGGAHYLDSRQAPAPDEMIVRYRVTHGGRSERLECVCHKETLQIIDAGICLTQEYDGEWDRGTKGDTWFTLESLPTAVRYAIDERALVIFRRV